MSDNQLELSVDIERDGELFEHKMLWVWIDGAQLADGDLQIPIVLSGSDAKEYADCVAIRHDLGFAKFCFSKAMEADPKKASYRAFVNAGLMSYARAFDRGLRSIKLQPEQFAHWSEDERKLHDHLFSLRQKHVAHSVNEYEYCDPIGMVVLEKDTKHRKEPVALGVIVLVAVGMSTALLEKSVALISDIETQVHKRMNIAGRKAYRALKEHLNGGGGWEMAPIAHIPDPANVAKARKPNRR